MTRHYFAFNILVVTSAFSRKVALCSDGEMGPKNSANVSCPF